MTTRCGSRRRGTVYVLVLGCAMLMAVVGVSALMSARVTRRATEQSGTFANARMHAQSALELGMFIVKSDPDWRTDYATNLWLGDIPMGNGTFSLYGLDPDDGDLADDADDTVRLIGVGADGDAGYALTVKLEPTGPRGMDCLASAVHANYAIYPYQTVAADAPISSNVTVTLEKTAVVNADVEVVSTTTPTGTINGTITTDIDPKETPDVSLLSDYAARGALIKFGALPVTDEGHPTGGYYRIMSDAVLSPASNPFGAETNANGIYVVDCQGYDLRIENMRISGTLVILNSGLWSEVSGAVHWKPAQANLPALLANGYLEYHWSGPLNEASLGVNFNPAGTPHGGTADDDTTDTYLSLISGVVAIWGRLDIYTTGTCYGALIMAGDDGHVYIPGNFSIKHDAGLLTSPPYGFQRAYRPMEVTAGSWQRWIKP